MNIRKYILGIFIPISLSMAIPIATLAAPYTDVPSGSWYESVVQKFKDSGLLYRVRTNFLPSQNAIRADFVQLIVDAEGGIVNAPPRVASFNDASPAEWYYVYLEEAARLGWVKGDGACYGKKPCYARPLSNVNRAEAAALLVRAFGFEQTGAAKHFNDNTMGQWFTNDIQTAADHCILRGDDATGMVRPGDFMNRAEMVSMIDRATLRQTYGIDCGEIQAPAPKISTINPISETRIVLDFNVNLNAGSATDTLRYKLANTPDVFVTDVKMVRPNAVELGFSKALTAGKRYSISAQNLLTTTGKPFADSSGFTGYTNIADSKSTLSVTSVPPMASKISIPRGGLRIPVLSLDFAASCDASYSIEGLTITREGFGSKDDFDGVYAVLNGTRISRTRGIEASKNTVSMHFTRPVTVPACTTRRIEIMADARETATTSGEHRFVLRSAVDIDSNAKEVKASFPLKGSTYAIAAITSGKITFEYRSVSPSEVRVGDKDAAIGRFFLTANSVENHTVQSVLLKQDGSLKPGDIQNIRLRKTNGETVSNIVKSMSDDYVLLTFNPPFVLKQGDNVTFDVAADIIGGAGRTMQFILEEESDLLAYGTVHGKGGGFGSRVALSTKTNPAFVGVDAGGFIVEVDGPSQQSYNNDERSALLANILMTSGNEAASVRSMYVLVQAQTSNGSGLGSGSASDDEIDEVIKNVKIRNTTKGRSVTGVRLSGSNDAFASTAKTYQIYRFDDFNIRGKELWQFEVDFVNNGQGKHTLSGDKFRIHICGEPTHVRALNSTAVTTNASGCDFGGVLSTKSTAYQMRVEGLSTGDKIADVRPRGSISGNFQLIATAALTVYQQATGSSDTTTKGAKNISLMRFEARAGSTKGIVVTRLSFETLVGSLQNGQNYQLWVDANGDGVVETPLQTGASPQGTLLTFSNFINGGYTISAGKTVVFEVISNIASSPPSSTLQLKFATGVSTFIEAEKVDGSTLSGVRTDGVCGSGTCDISVSTEDAKLWTIVSQGNLFVTKSTSPIRTRQVLGGELSDTLLRLTFRADNEAIDVTDVHISSSGSTASSIERLELFIEGTSQPFAMATTSGCGNATVLKINQGTTVSTLCASMKSQQLVIPAGKDVQVLVKARAKADTSGGVSGQPIQFWITGQTSGGIMAVAARGISSSTNLLANDGNGTGQGEVMIGRGDFQANAGVVGPKHTSVLTKIASIVNASPDANGSAIPTGTSEIGQFAFAVPANLNTKNGTNDVVIKNLLFTLNATNVGLDSESFRLVRRDNSGIEHACTVTDTVGSAVSGTVSGNLRVFCENLVSSAISTTIGNGETGVFMLRVSVENPSTAGKSSTLQVSLQNITNTDASAFGLGVSHIEWLDKDAQSSQSFFWLDQGETTVTSTTYRQ